VAHKFQGIRNFEIIQFFDEFEISDDEPSEQATAPEKKVYSEPVSRLIKKHSSQMTAQINHFKGRKTAIDMWETVGLETMHPLTTHCKAQSYVSYVG